MSLIMIFGCVNIIFTVGIDISSFIRSWELKVKVLFDLINYYSITYSLCCSPSLLFVSNKEPELRVCWIYQMTLNIFRLRSSLFENVLSLRFWATNYTAIYEVYKLNKNVNEIMCIANKVTFIPFNISRQPIFTRLKTCFSLFKGML